MLGRLIKEARIAAGITQEELSHAAGIDRSYLSQLERNLKSPTVQMLFLICGPLGTRPSLLIAALENSDDDSRRPKRKSAK